MTDKSELPAKETGNGLPLTESMEVDTYVVAPLADVIETPEAFLLALDMPGATKENISVTLEKGTLRVKGYVEPLQNEGATVIIREIRTTGYSRAFTIGEGIDRNRVEATLADGVLSVKLFKAEELKPRQITIQ
jgi:HSP20 family protein